MCATWTSLRRLDGPFLRSPCRSELVSAANRPLCIETRAIIERLLRSDAGRRKSSIQIGAPYCLSFWHSLREEYGKTPDECISRAGAVDAFDGKRGHVLAHSVAREQ